MGGAMSRTKGHAFEREIASRFRELGCQARRSLQAHQPYEPDVVVVHQNLDVVNRLWLECNHATRANPKAKLAQAVRDIARARSKGKAGRDYPWVVWKETGSRQVNVTMPAWTLREMFGEDLVRQEVLHDWSVTISWDDAVKLLGLPPAE